MDRERTRSSGDAARVHHARIVRRWWQSDDIATLPLFSFLLQQVLLYS
jgi:hypothetical protein